MTLHEYVTMHEGLRAKMIVAKNPDILDLHTTVTYTYMIDAAPIGTQLIAMNPARIKEFMHKFNRITVYQQKSAKQHQIR